MTPPKKPQNNKRRRGKVREEVSAGGLVYKRTKRGPVFALILDPYQKWAFPKGHVETGEAIEEAAARESLEELGIESVTLVEPLGKIDIWFRDRFVHKGALIHKDIYFFLFQAADDAELNPQEDYIKVAKWVPLDKLLEISSYDDMVPIIKRSIVYFKQHPL